MIKIDTTIDAIPLQAENHDILAYQIQQMRIAAYRLGLIKAADWVFQQLMLADFKPEMGHYD